MVTDAPGGLVFSVTPMGADFLSSARRPWASADFGRAVAIVSTTTGLVGKPALAQVLPRWVVDELVDDDD